MKAKARKKDSWKFKKEFKKNKIVRKKYKVNKILFLLKLDYMKIFIKLN